MKIYWLKKRPFADFGFCALALLIGTLLIGPLAPSASWAQDKETKETPPENNQQLANVLPGPMPGTVVRVVDGDTLRATIQIWLGQVTTTLIRVRHLDTPELKSKCPQEREKARAARDLVASLAPEGSIITVQNIETDKYGGRVIADVILPNGQPLRDTLITAGLARPYEGKTRQPWCSPEEIAAAERKKSDKSKQEDAK